MSIIIGEERLEFELKLNLLQFQYSFRLWGLSGREASVRKA